MVLQLLVTGVDAAVLRVENEGAVWGVCAVLSCSLSVRATTRVIPVGLLAEYNNRPAW